MKTKIAAIILTFNEEIHIERCIRSILPVTDQICVVDSFSTDNTVEMAKSLGAKVAQREWKHYSDQFAWGLQHFQPKSEWLLRMDADEYFEPDLQEELPRLVHDAEKDLMGIYLKRKTVFNGKWIRHGGTFPMYMLRVWRNGAGEIEQRWKDAHVTLPPGTKTTTANGGWVDESLKGITFWVRKHNKYASGEAIDLLNIEHQFFQDDQSLLKSSDRQAKRKRIIKRNYYSRLPLGFRALLYFLYRYILLLGFLDGREGFVWHFLQGYWYRHLVDVKIREVKRVCGDDKEKMIAYFRDVFGLDVLQ